jgi:hypothetical protein
MGPQGGCRQLHAAARGSQRGGLEASRPPHSPPPRPRSNLANTGVSGDVPASLAGKVSGVAGGGAAAGQAQNATQAGDQSSGGGAANATAVGGGGDVANATAGGGGGGSGAPSSDAAASPAMPDASQSPPAASAPPPTVISDAPICACALQGVSSSDCLKALNARCSEAGAAQDVKDACAQVSSTTTNADAAAKLATFLAGQCFVGQGMDASPCVCFKVRRGAGVWGGGVRSCPGRRLRAAAAARVTLSSAGEQGPAGAPGSTQRIATLPALVLPTARTRTPTTAPRRA